jgi:hypothetical protein
MRGDIFLVAAQLRIAYDALFLLHVMRKRFAINFDKKEIYMAERLDAHGD